RAPRALLPCRIRKPLTPRAATPPSPCTHQVRHHSTRYQARSHKTPAHARTETGRGLIHPFTLNAGGWRLCRYADDLVLMVSGDRRHAEALREEVAAVLAPLGLRLSPEKTRVVHIDEGFTFLGFDI